MLVLLLITPVFQRIPYNAMGAIVLSSVLGLFEISEAGFLFKANFLYFLVWMAAFTGTIFLGVEIGLALHRPGCVSGGISDRVPTHSRPGMSARNRCSFNPTRMRICANGMPCIACDGSWCAGTHMPHPVMHALACAVGPACALSSFPFLQRCIGTRGSTHLQRSTLMSALSGMPVLSFILHGSVQWRPDESNSRCPAP
jgi:hypothetical protein